MNKYKDEKLVRFIHSHPSFPWSFRQLSMHPNLTLRVIQEFSSRDWEFYLISYNKNFDWSWVQALPEKQWYWNLFHLNAKFSWKWVQEFPDKSWDWRSLSHMVDDVELIREFHDKPWDWNVLTLANVVNLTFMMENPYPWNVHDLFFGKIEDQETIAFLTMFANIYDEEDWEDHTRHATWKVIKSNMNLPWVFRHVYFKAGDFEESDVRYLLEKPGQWNIEYLSRIADYTTVIKPHPEINWNIKSLSRNPTFFSSDLPKNDTEGFNLNCVHLKDDMREWHAAQTIKRYWKRAITDPSRSMCRKVFLNDMELINLVRSSPATG